MDAAAVRIRLTDQGQAVVEVAAHDVGTGAYTVIAQMTAQELSIPIGSVEVRLADSRFPPGPVSGGSVTTASVCSAIKLATDHITRRLASAWSTGLTPGAARLENSALVLQGSNSVPLAQLFEKLGTGAVEFVGEYVPQGAKPGALSRLYKGGVGIVGGPWMTRPCLRSELSSSKSESTNAQKKFACRASSAHSRGDES